MLSLVIRREQAIGVASARGQIDSSTVQDLQAGLLPVIEDGGSLLLDMSEVISVSSAGLRLVLLLYREALARGGRIVLVGLSEEIRDTMSMVGFLECFLVAETLEEGLAALGQEG